VSNLVGGVGREVRDFERGARYKPSWQRKHLRPRIFSRPGRPDPGGGQIGQQAPTAKGGGRIEIIRSEGEGELARTFGALWWSGLAAGISIGFSVVSQAMLTASLAGLPGATIISNLGYSVGFLIVILSRQQLFTENTLTAVLPVIASREWRWFGVLGRLWTIVLVANLVGCLLFSAFLVYSDALTPEISKAVREIGEHLMANAPGQMFVKGVVAGWLICRTRLDAAFGGRHRDFRYHVDYLFDRAGRVHARGRRLCRGTLHVACWPRDFCARGARFFSCQPSPVTFPEARCSSPC